MPATLEKRPAAVARPVRRPPASVPPTLQRAPRRRWLLIAIAMVLAAGVGGGAWALVDHYTGTHGTSYVAPVGAPAIPAFDPAVVAKYGPPDPWMLAVATGGISVYTMPVGAPPIAAFDPAVISRYGPPDPWLYAVVTQYTPPVGAPAVPAFDPAVVAQYGPPDPWMMAAFTGGFS